MDHDGTGTDVRKPSAGKGRGDMDSRFFVGCTTIAVASVGFFVLQAWPFFVFHPDSRANLAWIGLTGALPTIVLGGIFVRKLGLEGGTALIGGTVSGSVFAFLSIDSYGLGRFAQSEVLVAPDFPALWAWLIPVSWALSVTAVTLFLLPQPKAGDEVRPESDR